MNFIQVALIVNTVLINAGYLTHTTLFNVSIVANYSIREEIEILNIALLHAKIKIER